MSTTALPVRRAPDATAILLMIALCAVWGFQQVAIKGANASFPPLLQAGIRSTIATILVWLWIRSRGITLFRRDNTLASGLLAGVLFGGEFVCIFLGLTLTSATRMVVFLYTAPCFMALGLHWFVAGEKLKRIQWAGIALAFGCIALAFADGFLHPATGSASTWQDTAGDCPRRARRRVLGSDNGRHSRITTRLCEREQDAPLSARGIGHCFARARLRARVNACEHDRADRRR